MQNVADQAIYSNLFQACYKHWKVWHSCSDKLLLIAHVHL
jgi:hypothetical protein